MSGLQRRDDAFCPAEQVHPVESFGIRGSLVAGQTGLHEVCVLRPDPWIVETGTDRVGLEHLPGLVLEQVRASTVDHTRAAGDERRSMLSGIEAVPAGDRFGRVT